VKWFAEHAIAGRQGDNERGDKKNELRAVARFTGAHEIRITKHECLKREPPA
jgi:hypothetical protein